MQDFSGSNPFLLQLKDGKSLHLKAILEPDKFNAF